MKKHFVWLAIPWALFFAAAAGWSIYWFILAGQAQSRIEAWAAAQNAQGAQVSIGRIERRGYPALLRLDLNDVSYAPARGDWRASTRRAALHVEMLNPAHVIVEARAPITVSRADGADTTVSGDAIVASLRTAQGALAVAGLEADNLIIDDPSAEGVLLVGKLVTNVRPDPRAEGDYQIAFEAQRVTLPRPVRSFESFGLDVASLRAAAVATQAAALLEGAEQDPLGPWREAGGRLRFEALALSWGPLETNGSGQGGLDAQRRLEGALELPIERPAPVLSALANGPGVDDSAKRALALLAAGYAISGDDIRLDVEAANGVLRLEGLSVRLLPPVY